jgi:pantoate--beta-alanine ligase
VKIIELNSELTKLISELKSKGKIIGFIPTMGSLHQGHLSMVLTAKSTCDIVVVSVFVNPTQFNNPDDLLKYPRNPERDAKLLEEIGCDIVFFPSVAEIYPPNYVEPIIPLGNLDKVMEGAFRPGHFQGVVQVVSRLFEIVLPNKAYFGLKDFQQVAVVNHLVEYTNSKIEIMPCNIVRDQNGLALSSRNQRLNDSQKVDALHIYKTLQKALESPKNISPQKLKQECINYFNTGNLKLEYLIIANPFTLEELQENWVEGAVMCIACYCGDVRLIDNMKIN